MSSAPASIRSVEGKANSLRLVQQEALRPRSLPPLDLLRAAAVQLDGGRSVLHETDANRAIRLWEGLLCGRWTLVDWFDAEGRRFIIARLNAPGPRCPRGLTNRERQVALSAALGESSKATGYRLGVSPSRISALLKAAMGKLGVRTKAQLVVMVRVLNGQNHGALSPTVVGAAHNV